MKYILILIMSAMAISCSKSEQSNKDQTPGITRQGDMPETGAYNTCDYERKVIFGSFAYSIYSHNNLEIFWNRSHAAYYLVIIKDKITGKMFTSPYLDGTSFFISPASEDINGDRLDYTLRRKNPTNYWVDIFAFDKYYNHIIGHKDQKIKRWIDIPLHPGNKHREAGFCSFKPPGFY